MTLDELLTEINNITPTQSNEIIIPKSIFKPKKDESIYCKLINTIYYTNYECSQKDNNCLICDQTMTEMSKGNTSKLNVSGISKNQHTKKLKKNKKHIISSDEKSCPICLTEKLLVYSLCKSNNKTAKHYLCYSCFEKWIETKNDTCPICRKKISKVYYEHDKYVSHVIQLKKVKKSAINQIVSTTFNVKELSKDFFEG